MTTLHQPLFAGTLIAEQADLERLAVTRGVKRYRKAVKQTIERGDGASLKPAERLLLHWFEPLVEKIENERKKIKSGEAAIGRNIYGPVMMLLDADRTAYITLHTAISKCMTSPGGTAYTALAYEIGRNVVAEIQMGMLKVEAKDKVKEFDRQSRTQSYRRVNWFAKRTLENPLWERTVCASVGGQLLYILMYSALLEEPNGEVKFAFDHETRKLGAKKSQSFFVMSERAYDIIEQGHSSRQLLEPRYLPMLVEPFPFGPDLKGGYIQNQYQIISRMTPVQKKAIIDAGEIPHFYRCFNATGKAAWKIDRENFAAINKVWEDGGGELLVPLKHNVPMPPEVIDGDEEAVKRAKADRVRVYRRNIKLKGERGMFSMKMEVARLFHDRTRFYEPPQGCFRMRTYSRCGYFNHQGDDLSRGLLMFADHKEPNHDLLKVHAANCWGHGVDKLPFAERRAWVDAHASEIIASAKGESEWWKAADEGVPGSHDGKPWQFLQACRALIDDEVGGCIPIQLDGTCNGLQHYTAIGRDEVAAPHVGLFPGDAPGNLYGEVAKIAKVRVLEDSVGSDEMVEFSNFSDRDNRIKMPVREIATKLAPHIDRSACKDVVMIAVYGATAVGSRKAVAKRLAKLGFAGKDLYAASQYLSRVVVRSLATVCARAYAIMTWLKDVARMVTAMGQPLTWTTPLGFPVVQPYRKKSHKRVSTVLRDLHLRVEDETVPIDARKHISSFAPNFIHSIDSTHWLMVADRCHRDGVTVAAVHDSFWTHSATVDHMVRIIREEFVALHSADLLGNLKSELESKIKGLQLPAPPTYGVFDLNHVLNTQHLVS